MVFRSKVDVWVVLVLFVALLAPWVVEGESIRRGDWVAAVIPLAVSLLVVGLVVPTRYRVTDRDILVRCGPFRWSIPVASVVKIEPTRTVWSSPALSLDRLRIDYRVGRAVSTLMVSPADKDGFRAAVAAAQAVG